MSEWKECKLGELIDVKHGFAFKGEFFQTEPNENILITPGNFKIGGGWKENKCKYYNGKIPEEYVLTAGNLIVTMTDLSKEVDTLGYSAIVPSDPDRKFLHNQRIGLIIQLNSDADLSFLNWLMRTPEYRFYVVSSASGSTVSHTSPSRIKGYAFSIPPLPEQHAIASVLSSLDDKIDLLHHQNKTLEAMAETLFRQWFVEEADEGWGESSLLELIRLVGGGTPKTDVPEYWGGGIPWLAGGDVASNHKSFVLNAEKTITENGLNNSSAKLLMKYATVITARGTVGKYCLLAEPMAFSQSNYGILPNIDNCFLFTYLIINHVVGELQSSAYGSVFDTITTTTFKENKVLIPSETEIRSFENTVSTYFQKIFLNKTQIRTLEKLRDTLLPKLMSGEVRVKYEQEVQERMA